jgi:hypothetical protein
LPTDHCPDCSQLLGGVLIFLEEPEIQIFYEVFDFLNINQGEVF